ncbi:hypothetical protein LG314_07930 [Agrococcus terreus]|uniref:hypothetical protein n=1 Tax=Agrococcus terreus TaxID=574649 RepID=UPI00384E5CCC
MAQIALNPIRLSNVLLRIVGGDGGGDFEKHVSQVEFTPSTGSVEWKGMHPDAVFNFPTATTWTATLAYAQDWTSSNSLSGYLFDNEGETVTMVFMPKYNSAEDASETNPAWRVNVTIVPGAIGGSVDSVATAQVTLQVQGKPQRITTLA